MGRKTKNKRYIVTVTEVIEHDTSVLAVGEESLIGPRSAELTSEIEEREIYSQNVKQLDLAEVIKAVNH